MLSRPFLRAITAVVLLPSLTGCGIIFQSVAGWSDESKRTTTKTHRIDVIPQPAQATVFVLGPNATEQQLGIGPVTESVDYQVEETIEESPNVLPLLLGSALDVAVAIGGTVGILGADLSGGEVVLGVYYAGFVGLIPLAEWIMAGVFAAGDDRVVATKPNVVKRTYVARLNGQPDVQKLVDIPYAGKVEMIFGPGGGAVVTAAPTLQPTAPPAGGGAPPSGEAKVVAVMEVEDSNAGVAGMSIDPMLLRNISDQLRIFIAETGFRTIDRGSQERALKDQIGEMKSESYKTCYDEGCQIDLGKALAAGFLLRSRVTRFGTKCVLNGELIDLRAEVTVAAAASRGSCEPEGFIAMAEEVARSISSTSR